MAFCSGMSEGAMIHKEWPAEDYAVGSYIQAAVADRYLDRVQIKPTDAVLDVGCGDGAYSLKIVKQYPMASFLGIDASENMLSLARKTLAGCPYASVQAGDVTTMSFDRQFDYILSYWCLQWSANAIGVAFEAIYNALKRGGQLLALFPTGDDPFMTTFETVKQSGQFPVLNSFKPPIDYDQLQAVEGIIERFPFKHVSLERQRQLLVLPSLNTFRSFLNGLAFFQGQIPDKDIKDINEAMVNAFAAECHKKYRGEWHFEFIIYCLAAEK